MEGRHVPWNTSHTLAGAQKVQWPVDFRDNFLPFLQGGVFVAPQIHAS
jgi:hypothetical protein